MRTIAERSCTPRGRRFRRAHRGGARRARASNRAGIAGSRAEIPLLALIRRSSSCCESLMLRADAERAGRAAWQRCARPSQAQASGDPAIPSSRPSSAVAFAGSGRASYAARARVHEIPTTARCASSRRSAATTPPGGLPAPRTNQQSRNRTAKRSCERDSMKIRRFFAPDMRRDSTRARRARCGRGHSVEPRGGRRHGDHLRGRLRRGLSRR